MKFRAPILASLAVVVLLVCHGSFGGTGELSLEPLPAVVTHQGSGEVGAAAGHSVEHSASHVYYYVAALCTVLLGSLFGLLLGKYVRKKAAVDYLPVPKQHYLPAVLYGGTGPAASLLQVFRL